MAGGGGITSPSTTNPPLGSGVASLSVPSPGCPEPVRLAGGVDCPALSLPQHVIVPSIRRAHVWASPSQTISSPTMPQE